mgnify:CR=1 FL=1
MCEKVKLGRMSICASRRGGFRHRMRGAIGPFAPFCLDVVFHRRQSCGVLQKLCLSAKDRKPASVLAEAEDLARFPAKRIPQESFPALRAEIELKDLLSRLESLITQLVERFQNVLNLFQVIPIIGLVVVQGFKSRPHFDFHLVPNVAVRMNLPPTQVTHVADHRCSPDYEALNVVNGRALSPTLSS